MIYYGDIVRSHLLTPPVFRNDAFDVIEKRYQNVPLETLIMVKKIKREGIVFHYTTKRHNNGFVRQIVMFHELENDPLPVTIDEQEYEHL